ncbi:MAG: flagellin [Anaerolineae bacterium]|jgi:archaellum component FlaF (FlaF/FlaG flagellin family)|nr:flagellin [Anaerolineae bacterium]MDH7474474.1 hypothetical protein [Anaerolineae bacterium]
MDTAITALIIITLLILVVLTLSEQYLLAQDIISESWQRMEARMDEQARTDLTPVGATTLSGGSVVEVTLRNDGTTKLADFDQWDVILQYRGIDGGYYATWYPYGLGQNEWSVYDIFLDAPTTPEVFEPDILNPGEEVVIWVSVAPAVGEGTTNLATVVTPNGISASIHFTR